MKKKNWALRLGRDMMTQGRLMQSERGDIDIGAILVMGIGMIFLAVGFIMYPIIMTATNALLSYAYSVGNVTVAGASAICNDSLFTGFTAIVGITPLLVLIGFLSAGVFTMYLGVKIMKGAGGDTKLDLGTMLLLGISIIFIAIGLIILPVVLDAICSILYGTAGAGISSSYTGLEAILLVTPLLVLISFISGAVISGFFGIKKLTS